MSTYIYSNSRVLRYERKLKQAEKAGKHNKAKKYAEKLERLRAEAAEQSTDSDTDSDDDFDSDGRRRTHIKVGRCRMARDERPFRVPGYL